MRFLFAIGPIGESAEAPNVILRFIRESHLNEYSDVLGLLITIVGFIFIIRTLIKTRGAADAAKDAAQTTATEIRLLERVFSLQEVIADLEGIKASLSNCAWPVLVVQLPKLRKGLIEVRSANANLSRESQKRFQVAITNLREIEDQSYRMIGPHADEIPDVLPLISQTTLAIDALYEVLQRLRNDLPRI